ncbi:MAG: DUF167 family protein [Rickettsia endosymbiont of Bryobia graminum]|nr:DUF167 family protein [Rickettsia endosymbiont of Bryobia graminum]
MSSFFNYDPNNKSAILGLKIKANAKFNEIGHFISINNKHYLKLSIKAVPENGKANEAIINFLSEKWQVNKKDLKIIFGHTNNLKLLEIKNISLDYLNSHL